MKKCFILLLLTIVTVLLSAGSYPVKPGEKVLFFGDSITQSGRYAALLQLVLASQGVPDTDIMNAGVSGGTTTGGLLRIRHDVIDRKPDRVFVLLGMNDFGLGLYRADTPANLKKRQERLNVYAANMEKIVQQLKAAGITVVLMTPTAYDQYQQGGKPSSANEKGLAAVAGIVRNLAKKEKLDVIELHPYMTDMLKKNPDLHLCGKDLVHPIDIGHMVMTGLIADQLGITGPVADVTIPVSGKVQTRFAKVTNVQVSPEKIHFHYAPERLAVTPAKWFTKNLDIEKLYPFADKLNREWLKVPGLTAGNYLVKAGDKELGTFTADQLNKGIDLAAMNTPNRPRSEQAWRTAWKLYLANAGLRTLVQCHQLVLRSGKYGNPDPKDYKAVCDALDKWLAAHKPNWGYRKYYTTVINNYRKMAPNAEKMAANREALRKQLEKDAKPGAYDIVIEKVK